MLIIFFYTLNYLSNKVRKKLMDKINSHQKYTIGKVADSKYSKGLTVKQQFFDEKNSYNFPIGYCYEV